MGWFDSDYEAIGSVAFNQIAQQRSHRDTYFGDLVLAKARTGETTADLIRNEIFELSTAKLRRYKKKGEDYPQFAANLVFYEAIDDAEILAMLRQDTPVDTILSLSYSITSMHNKALAQFTYVGGPYFLSGTTTGGLPYIGIADSRAPDRYILRECGNFECHMYSINLQYKMADDDDTVDENKVYDTGIPADYDEYEGAPINQPKGMFIKYMYQGKTYYYYSEATKWNQLSDGAQTSRGAEGIMPVVSLQDHGNWEHPYYLIDKDDRPADYEALLKPRIIMFKKFGLDFIEMSEQVFEPEPIPEFGSSDWNRDYARIYDDNKKDCRMGRASKDQEKFCNDYATEQAYHDDLAESQKKMKDNLDNVTDVHFGFFTAASKLDEPNVTALLFTLKPLMGNMNRIDAPFNFNNLTIGSGSGGKEYAFFFKIEAGSLIIDYYFKDYTFVRRIGTVRDEYDVADGITSVRKRKSSWSIIEGSAAENVNVYSGDPIISNGVDGEYFGWKIEDPTQNDSPADPEYLNSEYDEYYRGGLSDSTMLELRVQDKPDSAGNPTYLEMRFFNMSSTHTVDVKHDGEHGTSQEVIVQGSLVGITEYMVNFDGDYSDVIVFPLSYEGMMEVPIFRRERLVRESSGLIIDGIAVTEVKWYQKGFFKIVMFVVAVAISWLTAGASFTMAALITAVGEALVATAIGAILQAVLAAIDSPFLAAIVTVVALVMFGNVDFTSFADMAMLMVEATGTYIQKHFANEMLSLQEEYEAFKEEVSDKKKEMDELEERFGLNKHSDKDLILWLATLPPVEDAGDYFARTLNTDLNDIDIYAKMNSELKLTDKV